MIRFLNGHNQLYPEGYCPELIWEKRRVIKSYLCFKLVGTMTTTFRQPKIELGTQLSGFRFVSGSSFLQSCFQTNDLMILIIARLPPGVSTEQNKNIHSAQKRRVSSCGPGTKLKRAESSRTAVHLARCFSEDESATPFVMSAAITMCKASNARSAAMSAST